MEDSHGDFSSGGDRSQPVLETEDLQEEEVWAVMKARESSTSNSRSRKNFARGPSSSSAWRSNAVSTPRPTPRSTADNSKQPELFSAEWMARQQLSAPLEIPDWSKISKRRSKKNLWDDACDDVDDGYGHERLGFRHEVVSDDGDDEIVPPHEYLARRLADAQIASFSMCEGVGRTLKGRDLSKLRNAILTKTGFIE